MENTILDIIENHKLSSQLNEFLHKEFNVNNYFIYFLDYHFPSIPKDRIDLFFHIYESKNNYYEALTIMKTNNNLLKIIINKSKSFHFTEVFDKNKIVYIKNMNINDIIPKIFDEIKYHNIIYDNDNYIEEYF